jgi:5'-deoxynucleotidase YfbR-like HD superfamily hydrolase
VNHTPSILTRSGILFDLSDPKPELVRLEDITYALSHINRFTGHTRTRWTVAQHSLLAYHLASRWKSDSLPYVSDLRILCLMHDAAEAYVGDISSPLKSLVPQFREIEKRIQRTISDKFDLPQPDDHLTDLVKTIDSICYVAERKVLMPEFDFAKHGHSDHELYQHIEFWCPLSIETACAFIKSNFFVNASGKGKYASSGQLAKEFERAILHELEAR